MREFASRPIYSRRIGPTGHHADADNLVAALPSHFDRRPATQNCSDNVPSLHIVGGVRSRK
jgi:hypothetical protein